MIESRTDNVWQANIGAFAQTSRSMIELGGDLTDADWARPTECPEWSVKDQYSHILGIERWLLGEASDGERRTMANTSLDVEAFRGRRGAEILTDLRGVIDRRVAVLESGAEDLTEIVETPFGRQMPRGDFMGFRAFDVWMHEQDVRRAVGRPGNLDAPAAECAARILGGALPFVIGKRAAAEPGQSVVVETSGRSWRIEVGEDRQARMSDDDGDPSVRLVMDWETFVRLGGGRVGAADAVVEVMGDAELARRVLAGLAITP